MTPSGCTYLSRLSLWCQLFQTPKRSVERMLYTSTAVRSLVMMFLTVTLIAELRTFASVSASSTSSGRLPVSSRSDLAGDVIFPLTPSSLPKHPCVWPLSDDVWRPDFVPPNVDLNPCDIKNGEVCDSRRGVPPRIPSIPTAGDEFCFVSPDKGGNCQQEQLQRQGEPEVPLSWINC